ncbi:putative hybrid NRPS/PKS enzyme [Pseudovirgaria hyperparasitica]|uniref:Putative hybrid NRPS/PKS enzyme n=1 Tax=Pseudovirgaria hyperparasitica TaxID=470096 RepID=A0A6A6WL97_9PEZI|nr:putative hybrid NRPS/PKS enzyme [Pseudovirgaria hyperparasitica]KAF2762990.1 putative hybrid NRPS/PKS enzyme [Pseudovirgaria hyperparasitica]
MPIIDTTKDLSALFTKQAETTPDALALDDDGTSYTYSDLHQKVDELAHRLRCHRVGRDSLVGVLLPRGADYVIACLAALRAGGAFLVLELAYPTDLLTDVIEDANPVVILTQRSEIGKLKDGVQFIALDDTESQQDGQRSDQDLPPLPADDDLDRLSFVAYSSGTTGKPKGIANPHRAPVLSYDMRFAISDLQPGDRVACNVFFVWEIIRPLLRGATVVPVPDETSYDPVSLVEFLSSKNITETLMTPTLLAAVLARHPEVGSRLAKLKTLWLNGEVVTTDLARRGLQALPGTRLLNCYSACETHEIACGDIAEMLENLDDGVAYCPVGKPLDPKRVYILNESGQKADVGVSGELFVGGNLLARGYINRPETTARAFTANPYSSAPGARMYRTGDLARLLPSGLLEIGGRVGAMIKLRGYSVVPGKVENAITTHLAVKHCAVIAHGEGLERQLVAYVVRDKDATQSRPALAIDEAGYSPSGRKMLSAYLAQYMIPALWVQLDEIPTHGVSGKIDTARLPSPPTPKPQAPGQKAERDPIDLEDIAEIWAITLNTSRGNITPEHSFFDLGGHSLLLAELASRFSKMFGFRVPASRLASPPTLNGHLETVRAVRDGRIAALQADLPAVLRADSVLEDDIISNGAKMCSLQNANTVLLTGGTGFLGAFLLNELLESTSAHILCLVRCNDPSEDDVPAGIARIRRNMIDFGLWNDEIMERIEIIPANLARKQLGLSSGAFQDIASRTDVIVHAAATVNLVYPYAALRDANVGGTREILRLASKGGSTVQYISSNGVLPPSAGGWPEEAMLGVEHVHEKLLDGYGHSKWVAEQLVVEASRRGMPVRIIRAGTISGHSTSGASNAWDLLNALFVESVRIGYFPDVPGWRAEMTPVDFVSKAIVHLGNQTHADQLVFHLGDPNPIPTKELFQHLTDLGYPTEPLEFDEWVAMWNVKRGAAKGGDGAFTVDILRSGMPSIGFLKGITVLNNVATRPYRAVVERPKVDKVLLETYTRHWYARGWLSHPPSTHQSKGGSAQRPRYGPLSSRVAVIVGASSGMGAAIAAALAREGCHLALAARRYDALEAIKRRLVVREGKVLIRKTDVTDRKQVEALITQTTAELGPVDILVSCAGVMYYTLMKNVQVEEWDRTVDVNCKGLLHCLSSVVPGMLAQGSGHIVAISSDAGRKVFPGLGVYSASKFFVEATLQSLRLETAGSGLRITSVQPGNTATDLLGMSSDKEAIKKYGEPTGSKILDPEDIASSIVYALRQPGHVAVNELLIEPRDEPI